MTAAQPMTVVGRHGESGDEIARDVSLPADLHASNLLAGRAPALITTLWRQRTTWWVGHLLVAVKNGRTRELVRRETVADLLSRDRV
jgi:diaminopimelate decarboxylase